MRTGFKLLSTIISLILLSASLSPAFGLESEDEQWLTPNRYEPGFQAILVSDIVNSFQMYSKLEAHTINSGRDSAYLCSSSSSSNCDSAQALNYNAVLGECSDARTTDCVSGLQSVDSSLKISDAIFQSEVNPNHINKFRGDSLLKIPDGAQPSIWNLPAARHAGGIQYAVVSGLAGGTFRNSPTPPTDFYAYLIPVERVTTGFIGSNLDGFSYTYPQCIQKSPGLFGEARIGCRGNFDTGVGNPARKCVLMIENGPDCYVQRPFPTDFSFKISFKLKESLNGWLHGRLLDPSISIENSSGSSTNITITAKPMNVPIFYYGDNYQNLPQELRDAYATKPNLSQGGSYGRICCEYQPDPNLRNSTSTPWSFGEDSIEEMKRWLKVAGDKSVAAPSTWSIRTLSSSSMNNSTSCFIGGSGLKGLVTTNATTYSDGPPKFVNNELQYRVASPHFSATGNENRGTYNLLIRSDVAKCLYGFSDKPIQATVMVTKSDGGTSNIATEVVTMNDGWLKLSAKNFTFSDPTIRIKLSQEISSSTQTPAANPSEPIKAVERKKSITCIKGQKKKVFTGTKPVCPSGFKKK
jgi:hypothetical protein